MQKKWYRNPAKSSEDIAGNLNWGQLLRACVVKTSDSGHLSAGKCVIDDFARPPVNPPGGGVAVCDVWTVVRADGGCCGKAMFWHVTNHAVI